jgi:hypothetical protein
MFWQKLLHFAVWNELAFTGPFQSNRVTAYMAQEAPVFHLSFTFSIFSAAVTSVALRAGKSGGKSLWKVVQAPCWAMISQAVTTDKKRKVTRRLEQESCDGDGKSWHRHDCECRGVASPSVCCRRDLRCGHYMCCANPLFSNPSMVQTTLNVFLAARHLY